MVRAILAGTKTQTRRVMRDQPSESWSPYSYGEVHRIVHGEPDPEKVIGWGPCDGDGLEAYSCPYGQPGDRLWVRESVSRRPASFLGIEATNGVENAFYRADSESVVNEHGFDYCPWWKGKSLPSIHMPRWASRLTLEVVSVRVERMQEISEADARAEGVRDLLTRLDTVTVKPSTSCFIRLWDSINAVRSFGWDANPCVWVVEFKPIESEVRA